MTDSTCAAIPPGGPHHPHAAAALAAAWVIYLGIVGPWLISETSTIAVLLGLAVGVALAMVTYRWLVKLASTKKDQP